MYALATGIWSFFFFQLIWGCGSPDTRQSKSTDEPTSTVTSFGSCWKWFHWEFALLHLQQMLTAMKIMLLSCYSTDALVHLQTLQNKQTAAMLRYPGKERELIVTFNSSSPPPYGVVCFLVPSYISGPVFFFWTLLDNGWVASWWETGRELCFIIGAFNHMSPPSTLTSYISRQYTTPYTDDFKCKQMKTRQWQAKRGVCIHQSYNSGTSPLSLTIQHTFLLLVLQRNIGHEKWTKSSIFTGNFAR